MWVGRRRRKLEAAQVLTNVVCDEQLAAILPSTPAGVLATIPGVGVAVASYYGAALGPAGRCRGWPCVTATSEDRTTRTGEEAPSGEPCGFDDHCDGWGGRLTLVIDAVAKAHLHDHLRWVREALVWKLDGLLDYDVWRPLTITGTNLLGLVKHNAIWDSRYFGEVFDRPFPELLPRWDDDTRRRHRPLGDRA